MLQLVLHENGILAQNFDHMICHFCSFWELLLVKVMKDMVSLNEELKMVCKLLLKPLCLMPTNYFALVDVTVLFLRESEGSSYLLF